MKTVIEYTTVSRHYHFFPDPKNRGVSIQSSRKDEIERIARKAGATEIEHRTRDTARDLANIGYSRETARDLAKNHYTDSRHTPTKTAPATSEPKTADAAFSSRSAAAKRAWETIRAKRAAKKGTR